MRLVFVRFWRRGFALMLTLLPLMAGMTLHAQGTREPHAARSDDEDCTSCHADPNHRSIGTLPANTDCVSCHANLVLGQNATEDEHKLSSPPGDDVSNPYRGMQNPPYHADSRYGEDPNPMILIGAGPFTMGSNDRLPDEGPQQNVDMTTYFIDKFEVTNLQYRKFINATHRRSPQHFVNRTFPEGKADHPVTFVSWNDADAYCQWAGKRLPTEQEWEKAARGTEGNIFPWGNEFDPSKANTPHRWGTAKKDGDTLPVGSFEAGRSPYGLYDMTGNVWEWTSSWYQPHPGNTHVNENFGEKYKVLKGGSWWDCSFYKCGISAPTYNRGFFLKSTKNSSFGFRCAKDATR